MLNLFKIKVALVGAAELPGYRRGAWFTEKRYGVEVKNVNTRHRACFIVYQSKKDPLDVLVELKFLGKFTDDMRPEVVPIPASIIREFVKDTRYEPFLVECGERLFIKGLEVQDEILRRPSAQLCLCTRALEFVESMGFELAAAATFPDRIHGYDEAAELNRMLNHISRFVHEMEDEYGVIKSQKEHFQRNLDYNKSHLETVERNMNGCHEMNRKARETLKEFGIDPDKYKRL